MGWGTWGHHRHRGVWTTPPHPPHPHHCHPKVPTAATATVPGWSPWQGDAPLSEQEATVVTGFGDINIYIYKYWGFFLNDFNAVRSSGATADMPGRAYGWDGGVHPVLPEPREQNTHTHPRPPQNPHPTPAG